MLALIPTFAASAPSPEPSTGDGALVRHLEGFGVRCVYAGDIRDGQDALLDYFGAADAIRAAVTDVTLTSTVPAQSQSRPTAPGDHPPPPTTPPPPGPGRQP